LGGSCDDAEVDGSPQQSVWRNGDFRRVVVGSTVNDIGDWMLNLALPIYVFTTTGSGRDTSIVFLIELVIGIGLGPYGGSLADRWDLRRTIVATNLLQAITLLPLLAASADRVWPVFLVTAAQAMLQEVNNPASFALIPRVVADDQLVSANAAAATGQSISRLVGAPLGGIIIGVGGLNTVVLVDAITFLVVAIAIAGVGADTAPSHTERTDERRKTGVRLGWASIRTEPVLIGYLVVQTMAALAFAMFPVLFITFVVEELGGGGTEIGIIRGSAAFGGLAAALLVQRYAKRVDSRLLMMWGYITFSVVAALFINAPAITTALAVYLVLFALSGLPNASSQIGASATAQRFCPPDLRGRLSGLTSATSAASAAVGTVTVGLVVDHVNVVPLFNAQAVVYLACGIASYLLVVRRHHVSARETAELGTRT
jgi:MFS family permease